MSRMVSLAPLVTFGHVIVLVIILLLKGEVANCQSGDAIDSIRLPWDNNETRQPFVNPLGDTVAIIDSSMVRRVPDDVITNKDNISTAEISTKNTSVDEMPLEPGIKQSEILEPDNGKRSELPKADFKKPIVVSANLNKKDQTLAQNQSLDSFVQVIDSHQIRPEVVPAKTIRPMNEAANIRESGINKSIEDTSVQTNGEIRDLKWNIPRDEFQNLKGNFKPSLPLQTFSVPLHLSTNMPFKYNFSHSHKFGHSSSYNVTWDADGIQMHSSNESFKQGKQAQHQTVHDGESGSVSFADKSEHSHNNKQRTRLQKNSNAMKLENKNISSQFNTKERSKHIFTDDLISFVRHNKTQQQIASEQTEVTRRNTAKPLVTNSFDFQNSLTENIGGFNVKTKPESGTIKQNRQESQTQSKDKAFNANFITEDLISSLPGKNSRLQTVLNLPLNTNSKTKSNNDLQLKSANKVKNDISGTRKSLSDFTANFQKGWSTEIPFSLNLSTQKNLNGRSNNGPGTFNSRWSITFNQNNQRDAKTLVPGNDADISIKSNFKNMQNTQNSRNPNSKNFRSSWHNSWWSTL